MHSDLLTNCIQAIADGIPDGKFHQIGSGRIVSMHWLAIYGARYSGMIAGGILAPTVYFLASNFMVWQGTTEAV